MTRGSAVAILLVFTLLGPLFGTLVAGLMLSVEGGVLRPDDSIGVVPLLLVIVYFPIAYLAGGLQAIATGVVAAGMALWRGRLEWWPAILAAAVLSVFTALRADGDGFVTATMVATHVGAAALCLLVCRLMLGRPSPRGPDNGA